MNKNQYNYPGKELWQDQAWQSRKSPIVPLTQFINQYNLEHCFILGRPESERNREGSYDPKPNALTNPAVVECWRQQGLHYYCTSMTFPWIAMVPTAHIGRRSYDEVLDTILVLVSADDSDPNWCMYILEQYRDYLTAAAKNKLAVIFVSTPDFDPTNQYISIVQEAIMLFHLNFRRLYLDISVLLKAGISLKSVAGFTYPDDSGRPVTDPDVLVTELGGIAVLDIAGRWTNRDSLNQKLIMHDAYSNAAYNRDSLINSEVGRKMAEGLYLEYKYYDAADPQLLQDWENMGVRCEFHEKNGEQWMTFVPLCAYVERAALLPCFCIMQEVNRFDPHQVVTGMSCFLELIKIAAQGECMLLFFALETLDDNDMLHEILTDAEAMYPLDRRRVYITGHSHNGRFSAEYMRRHPKDIAALATLGNEPGQLSPEVTSGFFVITDEQLAVQAAADCPMVNISGYHERNSMFPLHSDAPDVRPRQWVALNSFERRYKSWQRRLISCKCPPKTMEEIAATKFSRDTVEQLLGIPADKTEILHLDGSDNYIADIRNLDGNYYLRIIALDNMPHAITPAMQQQAWSFVRRFARDQSTGESIELYPL